MIELLNLKDERITFDNNVNNIVDIVKIKNEKIKIIKGILSYVPEKCYCCNSKEKLVKNGFDIVKIQISKIAGSKTILKLKKQKILCRKCNKGFTVQCKDHKKYSRKSYALMTDIDYKLVTTTQSIKSIAVDNNTSISTVKRKIEELSKNIKINKNTLPKVLCIDEISGCKTKGGKYNCVLVDGHNKKLKDIVYTRRKNVLDNYFKEYTTISKNKVEYFVTDMYETYISLAKKHFKNSKIIIDKFHIINNMSRALDDIRIKLMNNEKQKSYKYRLYKKYNKKLKKKFNKLSIQYKKYIYNPELNSEFQVLEKLLSYSNELSQAYGYIQDLYFAFEYKNVDIFRNMIYDKNILDINNEKWLACIKTFRKYQEYIENAIIYSHTNGITEAFNRIIKRIKSEACGYRNYENFRTRVLLYFNLVTRK